MKLGWPGVTDATSGLAFSVNGPFHHALHLVDQVFDSADVVLQLGGAITSRRLLDSLAKLSGGRDQLDAYIRVSPNPNALDPYNNITHRIFADMQTFHLQMNQEIKRRAKSVDILQRLPELQNTAQRQLEIGRILSSAFSDDEPVSEPSVASLSVGTQATNDILFLGNSMPVRDVDLYATVSGQTPHVLANRGASGIDGNIATAAGAARALARPATALIGDLAALHDLNSLSLLREIGTPFALVIVNNNGGGIFHFLPIAKHAQHFERLFGTPHFLRFEAAADMFGLPYHQPKTNGQFREARRTAMERNGATIIEVQTGREENVRLHRELDAKIRAALDKI
jgi:2-succinyl-5-enolpyruvyl-6-hydroxy-3-cyclohexene-1-carboxylate synthase